MKIRTEYKIGFVGLLTLFILYFGIMYLKGKDLFKTEKNYYAIFNDVSGLYKSNYIYLNGLKVGYIKDITNADPRAKKFLVKISIKSDIEIPNDSKIMIFSSDMLGSKALKISMGISPKAFSSDDTIQSAIENGMIDQLSDNVAPLLAKLNGAITNLDTLIVNVNSVLDKKTQANLRQSMANINSATEKIDHIALNVDGLVSSQKQRVENIINNAESITSNLKNNNDKLNNAIDNFSAISDTIAKAKLGTTIRETNLSLTSLVNILQKIDNGEGNMGLLINDDKLYKNLELSSKELKELIEDMKQHPKKYIRISFF
jgi:ABC-type transport system involved in resistance to organic solvents, periplasmic component